ncbi:uncharacterized protein [Primulina eburnea]|uniref:uncharacterized protein n=1 Tax=Primulina eburnea TaxID=1245227 RepID=UPI003C6CB950
MTWNEFKEQCHLRFGPILRCTKLGELSKLRQTSSVEDYQKKFEHLMARTTNLSQEQLVELFISGLHEGIAAEVLIHLPLDLPRAMRLARLYDVRFGARFSNTTATTRRPTAQPPTGPFIRRLNRSEMEEHKAKGLCYNCDELYLLGHRCKRLFWIETVEDETHKDDQNPPFDEEEPVVSIHALTGPQGAQTMQIKGSISRKSLLVLIDSGSTHCFLDKPLAQSLGLSMETKSTLRDLVANGRRIPCAEICHNVVLRLGEHKFCIDFVIIPLGGFGAILGVNWLQLLGPIQWDFSKKCMQFLSQGQQVTLQGNAKNQPRSSGQLTTIQVQKDLDHDLHGLLLGFSAVFEEPSDLPPIRIFGHKIILEHGTSPIAVRPYRYAHSQKDEIERQCTNMLSKGFIRHSSSSFSSPVILVPKADKTWRFFSYTHHRGTIGRIIWRFFLYKTRFTSRVSPNSHGCRQHSLNSIPNTSWALRICGYAIRSHQRASYIPGSHELCVPSLSTEICSRIF